MNEEETRQPDEELEVPGEEEVPEEETMNPDEADLDDTVDNAESDEAPAAGVPAPDTSPPEERADDGEDGA